MTLWPSYVTFDLQNLWSKFGDDWSKTVTCIAENVTISFKHEYRRHTLMSRCDVIGDVIIMTIILMDDFHTIFLYLLWNCGYIENSKILKNFQKWRKFEVRSNFFVITVTGSYVSYLDSQSNFLHFELLIDVLAHKLTELWRFKKLTNFLTSWPSYLTYVLVLRTCRNHGLVLATDQVWWWLADSFLRFCEISVQTNRWKCNRRLRTCQNLLICMYLGKCDNFT